MQFLSDLCHTQAAQAAGEVSRICAELVFGYTRHPAWDEQEHSNCFLAGELEELEETMPGIMAMAVDVVAPMAAIPPKPAPAPVAPGPASSSVCKANSPRASPARASPKTAPPTP